MIVDLPRRWRWIVAGECVVIAILAVMFVVASRSAERRSLAAEMGAEMAPAVASSAPGEAASEMAVAPVASVATTASDIDQVEVCGAGWLKTGPNGAADPAEIERLIQPAADNILAVMRSDSSELVRASAMLMGATGNLQDGFDALARTAASSTDPAAYALAFRECYGRAVGACQLLSAERWAQLDPENGTPWIYIFDAARERGDRAAQQEALYRIGSAQRSQSNGYGVVGAILGAAPDDDASRQAASLMVIRAIGIEAAVILRGYREIMAACRGDALKDPNRLQTCGAIATLFAERSDSLLESNLGATIGRQVGWPADRVDLLLGESNAYQSALLAPALGVADLGCAAVAHRLDVARQYAAGEPASARAWVARSGRSPDDFISEERARESARKGVR